MSSQIVPPVHLSGDGIVLVLPKPEFQSSLTSRSLWALFPHWERIVSSEAWGWEILGKEFWTF